MNLPLEVGLSLVARRFVEKKWGESTTRSGGEVNATTITQDSTSWSRVASESVHVDLSLFVAASHQTGLDTKSKARRPIKVGIKGRGRSGTSRNSNPAGLCCSSAHLVQCEPDKASSFTNPNLGPGTYAGLWLELDSKV